MEFGSEGEEERERERERYFGFPFNLLDLCFLSSTPSVFCLCGMGEHFAGQADADAL